MTLGPKWTNETLFIFIRDHAYRDVIFPTFVRIPTFWLGVLYWNMLTSYRKFTKMVRFPTFCRRLSGISATATVASITQGVVMGVLPYLLHYFLLWPCGCPTSFYHTWSVVRGCGVCKMAPIMLPQVLPSLRLATTKTTHTDWSCTTTFSRLHTTGWCVCAFAVYNTSKSHLSLLLRGLSNRNTISQSIISHAANSLTLRQLEETCHIQSYWYIEQ